MSVFNIARDEMKALPGCGDLSKEFSTRWSGLLLIDGKFVKVRGYQKKIPFIYAVDYLTHDIPLGGLFLSESASSFDTLLSDLQDIGYPLKMVVGDDSCLKKSLESRFPNIPFQLCQTHYLENVRQTLRIRTDDKYLSFFFKFRSIFKRALSKEERIRILMEIKKEQGGVLALGMVSDVWNRYQELFAYEKIGGDAPRSNNLIECYNSHLNGRLKTIKGFESFESAKRWLNAWMVRRRTKPLTDCRGKFKKLNGSCPIELSMKSGVELEDVFRFLNM